MQIDKCRICGSDNIEQFLDLGMQPWGNDFLREPDSAERYPLQLYFCHKCTLVQLGYTVPKEKMFERHSYMSGTTKTLVQHFKDLANRIIDTYVLTEKNLVVDIGGNDGSQLIPYAARGLRVLNVESGAAQANAAMKKGVLTWQEFFNEEIAGLITAANGQASIINASGVFFHLEELHSVCRGVKLLLAPGGVFIVQFVYLGSIIDKNAFDNVYHEHLLYYTIKSLSQLLEMYDLSIIDIESSPIHGGSLIAHVCHSGEIAPRPSVEKHIRFEEYNAYDFLTVYQKWANRIGMVKKSLLEILDRCQSKKTSVFGYGAPVKGTTLLNYCGVNSSMMQCAVEKNPLKCQRYYPGTDIPVIDESLAKKPDRYLVLAWNFLSEFMVNEKAYLKNGGKFIVPIPTPRIIGE